MCSKMIRVVKVGFLVLAQLDIGLHAFVSWLVVIVDNCLHGQLCHFTLLYLHVANPLRVTDSRAVHLPTAILG